MNWRRLFKPAPREEDLEAAEGLRILEHAIDHLQQYGTGRDCEESQARLMLCAAIDRIWEPYGVQPLESPGRIERHYDPLG